MFKYSRIKFFIFNYVIFTSILALFSVATYISVGKLLDRQLNKKLETLADLIVNHHQVLESEDTLLNYSPTLEFSDITVEWFDAQGRLLSSQGTRQPSTSLPLGINVINQPQSTSNLSYPLRAYTLKVSIDRSDLTQPPTIYHLRLSTSTEQIREMKRGVRNTLITTLLYALGISVVAGLWLTEEAVKPVEANVQKLKQVTTDVSHELRTPLMAVKGSIERIINTPEQINPENAEKLGIIANATETMTHLLDDLLFLARNDLNEGKEQQFLSNIAVNLLLGELVELLDPLAAEKGITLQTDLIIEGEIRGDRQQISRLFINLIENAIKYTPERGKVFVFLQKNHHYLHICVEDTGIGIAADQLPHIFDRFWRTDQARHEQGSGLGLSIAQAIAKQHGGNITETSRLGEGTSFKVSLPLFTVRRTLG
jgi:signal transduction histidine kinase